jgi:hypothetical protein
VVELFASVVQRTAENFRALAPAPAIRASRPTPECCSITRFVPVHSVRYLFCLPAVGDLRGFEFGAVRCDGV